jgi:hypothetical protein
VGYKGRKDKKPTNSKKQKNSYLKELRVSSDADTGGSPRKNK